MLGNLLGQFIVNRWGGDALKKGVSCSTGYSLGRAWLLTGDAIRCSSGMSGAVLSQPELLP